MKIIIRYIILVFFLMLSCSDSPSVVYVAPQNGCTDSNACNYSDSATDDDGSCEYISCIVYGCTQQDACNYNPNALIDDNSCYNSLNSLAASIDINDIQNQNIDSCILPDNTMYISSSGKVHYNSSLPIAGFQLNIDGPTDLTVSGGDSEEAGFFVNGSSTIIGVSLSGDTIPAGCGVLLNLEFEDEINDVEIIISGEGGVENQVDYLSGCNCIFNSYDDCSGICGGTDVSCNDCLGTPNGNAELDCSGECQGGRQICEVDNMCVKESTCSDLRAIQDIIDANAGLSNDTAYELADWNSNERAFRLYLSNKQVSTIPSSIDDLTELQQLFLSYNNISFLSFSIGNLQKLEHLYISWNELSTLPDSIGDLENLIVLVAEFNNLNELPTEINNLSNLETLNLGGNLITELPYIGSLESLQTLNINNNYITSLPSSITFLSSLNILNADSNILTSMPNGICDMNSLNLLSISGNQICDDFFNNICGNINVSGQGNQSCND
tara:strand:+ start:1200 stop:2690 length:1491 start_codon:yes stop_codon:yes gene_type:complete